MARYPKLTRRSFVKLCASAVALVTSSPHLLAEQRTQPRSHQRARLVDIWGQPVRAADLKVGENYLFHYPYVSTPCFLIDLGRAAPGGAELETEDGDHYAWSGGVGPRRSIVAFSAICSHRMTHPARSVSFINYRHGRVSYRDQDEEMAQGAQVIYCCSEKSVYDPADGARVLGGPAPQPLATVLLDYDADEDALYARGTQGGDMFNKFLGEFDMRLSLEFGTSNVRTEVKDTATLRLLAEYCQTQVLC